MSDVPPCFCPCEPNTRAHPLPSQVVLQHKGAAFPFVDCFGRAELEIAAGIYVWACQRKGDAWQPIAYPELLKTIDDAVAEEERTRATLNGDWSRLPRWLAISFALAITPDFPTLVARGWLSFEVLPYTDDEAVTRSLRHVAPTEKFFDLLHAKKLIATPTDTDTTNTTRDLC